MKDISKVIKEKDKKCKPYQIKLKCYSCGKTYCRSVPLYSCLICGGMIGVEK